jgi:D-alanyl-D-alanine carboxypeptidase
MIRIGVVTLTAVSSLVLGVLPAGAHIEADPNRVKAGERATVEFTPEHGCGESVTTKMEFVVPTKAKHAKAVKLDGWTATGKGRTIVFDSDEVPSEEQSFGISFTAPTGKGLLSWRIVQRCQGGVERWIEGPQGETPAPIVGVDRNPPVVSREDPELEETLNGIIESHRADQEFVGAVLAVRKADGHTALVTSGTKELGGSEAVDPDVPWGVGSATKIFVAVVMLQLAEEGRIDLDAGIDRYLPDLPGGERITPRQLLQHTSGLSDYLDLPTVQADAKRKWSPSELIAAADAAGRNAEPGGPYRYSNTGYLVLGEIIEKVTKHSWAAELRERIFEPLHMRNTGPGAVKAAPGYGVASGTFVDYTDRWHPSVGGAAGGLQSTASDLLKFAGALAAGRLLSDKSMAAMTSFVPGDDLSDRGVVHEYGLGLEKYATPDVTAYGHLGNGAAHSAFIGFDPTTGTAVVATMNTANPGPQVVMSIEALASLRA